MSDSVAAPEIARHVHSPGGPISAIGAITLRLVELAGSMAIFLGEIFLGALRPVSRRTFLPCLYRVGVLSLPVIMITGGFIGMVLAVQAYDQFRMMHLEDRLGAVVNASLVTELGPVLAAVMLAGRVGSAIAAELGTMRVTEQIDALEALGANPIRYLVVPRFLACVLLIPLLTAMADVCGMIGGWLLTTQFFGVSSTEYWRHSIDYIYIWDIATGLIKSLFFGGIIAMVSCHRGFHSDGGAEGVGKAATESFVISFVLILAVDFFLGMLLKSLFLVFWGQAASLA